MKTIGPLTADQMLARLDELEDSRPDSPEDGARTIREWGEFWGIDRLKASDKVKAAIRHGLMERVMRKRERVDGTVRSFTCFVWIGGPTN